MDEPFLRPLFSDCLEKTKPVWCSLYGPTPALSFGVLFPGSRVGWQEFERGYAADLLLPALDLPAKRNYHNVAAHAQRL